MSSHTRIVNTIPSQDAALRHVVDTVTSHEEPQSAAQLAEWLRPLYPRVAVFERQLSGERPHLYVYRDGRYEPEGQDRWWEADDVACVHVDAATGRLTAVTGSWAELMRASAEELVGRHFVDFVLPEARAAAQGLFEAVVAEREVRSEALLARPDGTTLAIEFRAIRRNGVIEVDYRPVEDPRGLAATAD
jgi:PAS domain-containing protein